MDSEILLRRRGKKARNLPQKIQFRFKRRNQIWHLFAYIGWNFKSPLLFYKGSGVGGRLIQADYSSFLEDFIAPDWEEDWVFLEDNDNAHRTPWQWQ